MLSSLNGMLESSAMNVATQKLLSQSNNVSYGTRGVVRVAKTPEERKGDYFFRDFFMVWVCGFMTEFCFRTLDRIYNAPLMTKALQLNKLSQQTYLPLQGNNQVPKAIYPGVQNYKELPDSLRARAMGTLVQNSSSLVPRVMREEMEATIAQDKSLSKALREEFTGLLKTPNQDAHYLENFLKKAQNGASEETINRLASQIKSIAHIDNKAVQAEHLQKLLTDSSLKGRFSDETIRNAVKAQKARQMGLFLDHIHKQFNFKEYIEKHATGLASEHKQFIQDNIEKFGTQLGHLSGHGQSGFFNELQEAVRNIQRNVNVKDAAKNPQKKIETLLKDWASSVQQYASPQEQKLFADLNLTKRVQDIYKAAKPTQQGLWDSVLEAAWLKSNPQKEKLAKLQSVLEKDLSKFFSKTARPESRMAQLKKLAAPMLSKMDDVGLQEKMLNYIHQGVESKFIRSAFEKIQKSGTWPKTFGVVLMNFVFYGWLASTFDNRVLQPYQKKLTEERGSAKEMAQAGYLGFLPGLAMFVAGMSDKVAPKMVQQLGYLGRFSAVGLTSLATFAGASYMALQQLLKRPAPNKNPQANALPPVNAGAHPSLPASSLPALPTPASFASPMGLRTASATPEFAYARPSTPFGTPHFQGWPQQAQTQQRQALKTKRPIETELATSR